MFIVHNMKYTIPQIHKDLPKARCYETRNNRVQRAIIVTGYQPSSGYLQVLIWDK
jgi:hypothetical protein